MFLGPAQRLHALALGRAARVDVLGDRGRADEADRFHLGMVEQRIDRHLVALDHVEHAVRQARLLEQARMQQRGRRIAFRGLEHEGIAAGDGDREHPHRHHHREVERRDAGHHAQRLAHRPGVDAARDLVGELALEQLWNADRELHHFNAARHLALRVKEGLAVLAGDHGREFVGMPAAQLQVVEQHPRALQRRRGGPGREGCGGRAHGGVDILAVGQRDAGARLAARRIEDIGLAQARTVDQLAIDEMRNEGHRS